MRNKKQTSNKILDHKTYLSYLSSYISRFPISTRFKEIYIFLKKYFLIGRILRYARYIFILLQTGANFLLFTSVCIFLFPILILLLLISFIYTFTKFQIYNHKFCILIKKYDFKIFLDSKTKANDTLNSFSTDKTIIIIVEDNPFVFTPLFVKRFSKNIYLISACYFYSLKKHVLSKHKNKVKWENVDWYEKNTVYYCVIVIVIFL